MLTGIGLVSTVAASVAAYFVGEDERAQRELLHARLARIELLLAQLAAPAPGSPEQGDSGEDGGG
jgi:hypothetical protein